MRWTVLIVASLATAPALTAQTTPPTRAQLRANLEAHQHDFDYLLGRWSFTAQSAEFGRYGGFWTAVRLEGPATVLDEFRATGDTGETYDVSSTLRSYNSAADRWELVTVGNGTGLKNIGTATKVGDEMHIDQTFGGTSTTPALWRIRYYNIRPDAFSWEASRSMDSGRTWTPNWLRIEATRIGPPPAVAPLAPARRQH